jgi:hypothetical protein
VKFYWPFWFADHLSFPFDPWKDEWPKGKENWKFLWELDWKFLPFDGVLISRPNIERARSWRKDIEELGLYRALRLPTGVPTFCDCGAWSYIREKEPPYDPNETLDFYKRIGVSLACTVDHIIMPETESYKERRQEITLRNAERMKNKWDSDRQGYGFELLGVAQGWDDSSYYQSVRELLDMGFEHIALGGQARSPSKTTISMLRRCHELWKQKQARVHLFGLARWTLFEAYREFGVTSFDGAYHRRAWISGTNNYELDDRAYTAIRIPLSHRLEASRRRAGEELVFDKLRSYDEARTSIATFLKTLHSYDARRVEMFAKRYERTLKDRPWEKCDCAICRSIGIHVCVFRTSERNMRRGFHNLWNFYRRFKESYGEDAGKTGLVASALG